jgi:hypothetical protein
MLNLAILLAAAIGGSASAQSPCDPSTPAGRIQAMEALYPPWQHDATDASARGLELTVAPADVLADFHGGIDHPDLVLYVSGNYFFAMAGLVETFGNPIGHVDIPDEHNTLAVYSAAMVPGAPHLEAARAWLDFIQSDAAFGVLARYDFKRYQAKAR